MSKLKPWAAGPFELIRHAEAHLRAGSDFDKRMALVSFDNAIEVSISTYLQLHPSQRGGKNYERKKVEEWLTSYHSKLSFLEAFATQQKITLETPTDEIVFFHRLRNELYHSGNGMVPKLDCLHGARSAALWVFSALFGVDAQKLLSTSLAPVPRAAEGTTENLSSQTLFLQSFITFEKALRAALASMGILDRKSERFTLKGGWDRFRKHAGVLPKRLSEIVGEAIETRNALVHGQPTNLRDHQIVSLGRLVDEVAEFVSSFAASRDILPELKKLYPHWMRRDLSSVRIVQKHKTAFLETTIVQKSAVVDEKVERTDLSFIGEDFKTLFPADKKADEHADVFLREMDPWSILQTTKLFRPEVEDAIAAEFGPRRGGETE